MRETRRPGNYPCQTTLHTLKFQDVLESNIIITGIAIVKYTANKSIYNSFGNITNINGYRMDNVPLDDDNSDTEDGQCYDDSDGNDEDNQYNCNIRTTEGVNHGRQTYTQLKCSALVVRHTHNSSGQPWSSDIHITQAVSHGRQTYIQLKWSTMAVRHTHNSSGQPWPSDIYTTQVVNHGRQTYK